MRKRGNIILFPQPTDDERDPLVSTYYLAVSPEIDKSCNALNREIDAELEPA